MVTREIKAHKAIDNPYVMPLIDCETVTKRNMREARMLFPYHKVNNCCNTSTFFNFYTPNTLHGA